MLWVSYASWGHMAVAVTFGPAPPAGHDHVRSRPPTIKTVWAV